MIAHHATYDLPTFLVGNIGNRASVYQTDIGLFVLAGLAYAKFGKHLPKELSDCLDDLEARLSK